MNSKLFAVLFLLVPGMASAQSMNAEQFHRRATALQHKGAFAIFSAGEIKALMREGQAAGLQAAENRRVAVSAGKPPRFCPTERELKMGNDEFMTRLSAIRASERSRIDMTEAVTRMFAAKFPCRR
jgi:hypothetical protein